MAKFSFGASKKRRLSPSRQGVVSTGGRSRWGRINKSHECSFFQTLRHYNMISNIVLHARPPSSADIFPDCYLEGSHNIFHSTCCIRINIFSKIVVSIMPSATNIMAAFAAIIAVSLAFLFTKNLPFEVMTDVYQPVLPKSPAPIEKIFPEILHKPLQVEDVVRTRHVEIDRPFTVEFLLTLSCSCLVSVV
jgi:hypothetical protein